MPITFEKDGSPVADLPYYRHLRPYEQAEFRFVIQTIMTLFPNADCDAKVTHTHGPMASGDQADLSWGRLTNDQGQPLQNVQGWVCRLICPGDKPEIDGNKHFPTEPKFNLPRDNYFLSFTRRIAFPIRLYNHKSGLPIWIGGKRYFPESIPEGVRGNYGFLPYFCDGDFSSAENFARFLERWLNPAAIDTATMQQPEQPQPSPGSRTSPRTNTRGRYGGAVRAGIAAGQARARAGAAMNKSKVERKKSEAKEAPKALEGPQPRRANAATSAQPKPQQLPAPSPENGDSVEGLHSADAALGTPSPKGPQSSNE